MFFFFFFSISSVRKKLNVDSNFTPLELLKKIDKERSLEDDQIIAYENSTVQLGYEELGRRCAAARR